MIDLIRAALRIFLLSISLNTAVDAKDIDDVSNAIERGDYENALRIVRPLAKQRNAEAQYYAPLIHFDPNDPIGSVFAPIIGLPAWRVQRGYSSCLTFEFGAPHLEIREPHVASAAVTSHMVREWLAHRIVKPRGEWHLWIYCCNWRISGKDMAECDSEDSFSNIDVAAQKLDGQRLANVFINPSAGTSHFEFDLGGYLETWPAPPRRRGAMAAFLPRKFCSSISGGWPLLLAERA
jgi:hypothetical protein